MRVNLALGEQINIGNDMNKKELMELLEEAYETGRAYGVADTEEFADDEKLDTNTFEAFIERNECRLTSVEGGNKVAP